MRRYNNSKPPCFEIYLDNAGEWRWTFIASNGEPIAVSSEGYTSLQAAKRGVEIMRSAGSPNVTVWTP